MVPLTSQQEKYLESMEVCSVGFACNYRNSDDQKNHIKKEHDKKMNAMSLTNHFVAIGLVLLVIAFSLSGEAYAVCCFPYDITHHIDPDTGSLVVSGELWNDSYKEEPFGNTDYHFVFTDKNGDVLFERDILLTEGHPIKDGFVIPLWVAFPFQVTMDDVDEDIAKQIAYVSTRGTNTLDYFDWKPADLQMSLDGIKHVKTIPGKTSSDVFDKWQIHGTIKNNHSERTENVYVLASLYGGEHDIIVGVAGYSDEDTQPLTLDGLETKEFALYATVQQGKTPNDVRLYAESDDSSMIHRNSYPIILKQEFPEYHERGDGTPYFSIKTIVSNISRNDQEFDFIVQIKKDPEDDDSITINDPRSTVEYFDVVPSSLKKQSKEIIEYEWTPTEPGVYFYEIYIWSDINNPTIFSVPFKASFLHHTMMSYDKRN